MQKYCERCEKWVEAVNEKRLLTFDIYGDEIRTENDILVCSECREEFLEIYPEILMKAYEEYRRRTNEQEYTGKPCI